MREEDEQAGHCTVDSAAGRILHRAEGAASGAPGRRAQPATAPGRYCQRMKPAIASRNRAKACCRRWRGSRSATSPPISVPAKPTAANVRMSGQSWGEAELAEHAAIAEEAAGGLHRDDREAGADRQVHLQPAQQHERRHDEEPPPTPTRPVTTPTRSPSVAIFQTARGRAGEDVCVSRRGGRSIRVAATSNDDREEAQLDRGRDPARGGGAERRTEHPGRPNRNTVRQSTSRRRERGRAAPPAISPTIASDSAIATFSGSPTR